MPQVSIILPVYNGERYLSQALESIAAQSMEDFECIIVNDCSTDTSLSIAEAFCQKDTRFRVLSNEKNSKLPFSLNVGHRAAKADFLTWTSDDNILLPTFLESHLAHFTSEVDITYAPYMLIDEHGKAQTFQDIELTDYIPIKKQHIAGEEYYIFTTLPVQCLCNDNCIGASFMYRKKVFAEINGYDESTFLYEDYDFWIRAFQAGMRYKAIPDLVYKYRSHPGALSARVFPERYYNFRYAIRNAIPQNSKDMAFETRMTLHRDICPHLPRSKHVQILWESFCIAPLKLTRMVLKTCKKKLF